VRPPNSISKRAIDMAIADVCVQLIQEPLAYFSEADIQALLFERLRQIKHLAQLYPTAVPRGKAAKERYRTSLVHREYGGGGRTRIDIVVLDPADVATIFDVQLRAPGKRYLQPAYAIELGTEKTVNAKQHLGNDLKKLAHCVKKDGVGYVVHIYKDTTMAPSGTPSRNRTEAKIKSQFKQLFEAHRPSGNIKVLAVLLRRGRNQRRMLGKCEIFDGSKWVKVNVSRGDSLKKAILDRLR